MSQRMWVCLNTYDTAVLLDDVEYLYSSKSKHRAVVREFLRLFKERNGSVECTILLGYNLSDPQQVVEAKKAQSRHGPVSRVCAGCSGTRRGPYLDTLLNERIRRINDATLLPF